MDYVDRLRGRSLKVLNEQFAYGHREILLRSYGLPENFVFPALVQHGWMINANYRHHRYKNLIQKYPDLVWSSRITVESKNPKTIAIGSAWSHLLKLKGFYLDDETGYLLSESNGTNGNGYNLYIPVHSDRQFQIYEKLNFPEKSSKSNSRNIVCLGWQDFVNPRIRLACDESGWQYTCAGYRGVLGPEVPWSNAGGRSDFLFNLFDIINNAENIFFDEPSTAFWYALSLGKRVCLRNVGGVGTYDTIQGEVRELSLDNAKILEIVGITNYKFGDLIQPSRELISTALSEIGWEHVQIEFSSIERYLGSGLSVPSNCDAKQIH